MHWAYLHQHLPVIICGLGIALMPAMEVLKRYVPYLKLRLRISCSLRRLHDSVPA